MQPLRFSRAHRRVPACRSPYVRTPARVSEPSGPPCSSAVESSGKGPRRATPRRGWPRSGRRAGSPWSRPPSRAPAGRRCPAATRPGPGRRRRGPHLGDHGVEPGADGRVEVGEVGDQLGAPERGAQPRPGGPVPVGHGGQSHAPRLAARRRAPPRRGGARGTVAGAAGVTAANALRTLAPSCPRGTPSDRPVTVRPAPGMPHPGDRSSILRSNVHERSRHRDPADLPQP